MSDTFEAQVADWVRRVDGALQAVFQEAAQELAQEMDLLLEQTVYQRPPAASGYKRTGFLRASLVASRTAMPLLTRDNPGIPVPADLGDVLMVIEGAEISETIFLGYTASYSAFVHYSANGQPGAPWVSMAAQRWPQIVERATTRVRTALGL
jgi:hypothetical protein